MKRLLLAALAVVAVGFGYALAQSTVVVQTLNGLEAWQVGNGPAGPGFYTTTQGMRGNTNAIIPTTTTFTQVISPGISLVIFNGAVTTANLSLPSAPFDGQTITIACPGGAVSTLNISVGAASSPSTISGPSSTVCSATVATSIAQTFVASANAASSGGGVVWNRIR